MKCLSIQQPWGSLIAYGIKDVENRTDRKLVPPQRILIHVGAKARCSLDDMPLEYVFPIESAVEIGAFDPASENVRSAIIGYVDVVDIITDSKSLWAQYSVGGEKPMQHYILRNAKLFRNPILGVKGRLGVWEIPEITEDNLPETVDIPKVERIGDKLFIPCGEKLWNEVCGRDENPDYSEFKFWLTLTEENIDILNPVDDSGYPVDPKTIIFKSKNGRRIEADFMSSCVEEITHSDRGEPIEYEDEAGNKYVAMEIGFVVKRK